jgi:uncharacterized protein with NAD-binding domain and iron-sulfur cluster
MTARRVAVFGGGVGGLSVAQELAERGFDVDLYERGSLGGKARSFRLSGTGTDGRGDMPAEIGPHGAFGFYASLLDTLRRVPSGDGGSVFDRFHPGGDASLWDDEEIPSDLDVLALAWDGVAAVIPNEPAKLRSISAIRRIARAHTGITSLVRRLTVIDTLILASKFTALVTSGQRRQWGQLEHQTAADFLRVEKLSPAGRQLVTVIDSAGLGVVGRMNPRVLARLVGAFGSVALGKAPGTFLLAAATGPYNDVIFEPWGNHLRSLGVRIHLQHTVTELVCDHGRITGATVTDTSNTQSSPVKADWYVLAVPPEAAAPLMNDQIVAADPNLGRIAEIEATWLGGLAIYLKTPALALAKAHICVGQPWSIAVTSYRAVWNQDFAEHYGDGDVKEYLSVDIPNWTAPGVVYGKPASELSPDQLFTEVLTQLRRDLPDGENLLPDSSIHSWHLSPSLVVDPTLGIRNDEPLFVNSPSSWDNQPDAVTAIPNLFLAAAYVRTDAGMGIDSMDSAAEAGRRAANGVLSAAGVDGTPVHVPTYREIPFLKPLHAADDILYGLGLPNLFDVIAPSRPTKRARSTATHTGRAS